MGISGFYSGILLSSAGAPTLAIMSYVLSATGFILGLGLTEIERIKEDKLYIQNLFEAEEKSEGLEGKLKNND
jgi:hypothetical protein